MIRAAMAICLALLVASCNAGKERPDPASPAPTTAAAPAPAPPRPRSGDVLWRLDPAAMAAATGIPGVAAWVPEGPGGATCLRVTVPEVRRGEMLVVKVPLDLTPWRGMIVSLQCLAKADAVSKPPVAWNGIKCMLHYRSADSGEAWLNQGDVHGTFDWRRLSVSAAIAEDAGPGELLLGMQESSGTAWIAEVAISALAVRPARPAVAAAARPAFRGHDLPRLRGVMSPNSFNERDFTDLAAMNVNAVRWQIGRNWGSSGGDRDTAEYDRWLDAKLGELDQALAAAARNGIRLLIDLHAPPGGRQPDGTLCMVLEQPYQDHFVRVWQRIATRYRGNPAVWGYDLINEPVQNKPSPPGLADWLGIQVKAGKAIREIDSTTPIVIESDAWDNPQRFAWMEPVDLTNVIYQAHMYFPGEFTHQGVRNTWGEASAGARMEYPGTYNQRPLDRAALARYLKPVRDFQLAYNVHVIIGEFSAARWAPGADRYLADCTSIFEEYGWDWTYHAFREWQGWSFEHEDLPYDRQNGVRASAPTDRAKVLLEWFRQNRRFPIRE